MEGGRVPPILSLDANSSWANLEHRIQERVNMHQTEEPMPSTPLSPSSSRLPREDMSIYGSVPSSDLMQLVVCNWCGCAIKDTAMLRHQDLHHSSSKTTALLLNEIPPHGRNSVAKESKSEQKRRTKSKDKYDPDRHCGVWLVEEGKNCLRSLTCKYHSLTLRRKVKDRSKPFDELLLLHKEQKKGKHLSHLQPTLNTIQGTLSSDDVQVSTLLDGASLPPVVEPLPVAQPELWTNDSDSDKDAVEKQPSVNPLATTKTSTHSTAHPKPLACCRWRSRTVGNGHLVFNRRQDQLYSSLSSLSSSKEDTAYCNSVEHRKHIFSLLHDEMLQRNSISCEPPMHNNYLSTATVDLPSSGHDSQRDARLSSSSSSSVSNTPSDDKQQFYFPKTTSKGKQQSADRRNSITAKGVRPKKKRKPSVDQITNCTVDFAKGGVSNANDVVRMRLPSITSLTSIDGNDGYSLLNHCLAEETSSNAGFTLSTSLATATQPQSGAGIYSNTNGGDIAASLSGGSSQFSFSTELPQPDQMPPVAPLHQSFYLNGMIGGSGPGLVPMPTSAGNIIPFQLTAPNKIPSHMTQFPGNLSFSSIPHIPFHEADNVLYQRGQLVGGQVVNQHASPFMMSRQPSNYQHSGYHINSSGTLIGLGSQAGNTNSNNCNRDSVMELTLTYSTEDKQSELSLLDSKNVNFEQISDQQQVTT